MPWRRARVNARTICSSGMFRPRTAFRMRGIAGLDGHVDEVASSRGEDLDRLLVDEVGPGLAEEGDGVPLGVPVAELGQALLVEGEGFVREREARRLEDADDLIDLGEDIVDRAVADELAEPLVHIHQELVLAVGAGEGAAARGQHVDAVELGVHPLRIEKPAVGERQGIDLLEERPGGVAGDPSARLDPQAGDPRRVAAAVERRQPVGHRPFALAEADRVDAGIGDRLLGRDRRVDPPVDVQGGREEPPNALGEHDRDLRVDGHDRVPDHVGPEFFQLPVECGGHDPEFVAVERALPVRGDIEEGGLVAGRLDRRGDVENVERLLPDDVAGIDEENLLHPRLRGAGGP